MQTDDEKLAFVPDLSGLASGNFCVVRTGYPYTPSGSDNLCFDHSECDADAFCKKGINDCNGWGQCSEKPDACYEIYDLVCGCDGITYDNNCFAQAAGVNVAYKEECK